jgi:hypothetical protein
MNFTQGYESIRKDMTLTLIVHLADIEGALVDMTANPAHYRAEDITQFRELRTELIKELELRGINLQSSNRVHLNDDNGRKGRHE